MADEPVEAAEVVADPVAEVVASVETTPEPQETAPPVEEKDHGNKGKQPWFLGRINEETNKRVASEEALRAERSRAESLQAIIERMQTGKPPEERTTAPARTDRPASYQDDVKAEAAKMRLYDDTVAVKAAGLREFPQFEDSLKILHAVGATNDDVVLDILAVDRDNAHRILDKLAKDPERAASLVGMDSRRRTVELTRMSLAEQKIAPVTEPTPKQAISRAPAPKPALSPAGAAPEVDPRTPEGNAKMDDAQWETWAKSTYKGGFPYRAAQ